MYKLTLLSAILLQPFLIQPEPIPIRQPQKIEPVPIVELRSEAPIEPVEPIKPKVVQHTPSGDWVAQCHAWAAEAGISLPPAAIKLIEGESHCDPSDKNPESTAYGIGQFLDSTWSLVGCKKTSDPVIQLKCMERYVMKIYGSWEEAWRHFQHPWKWDCGHCY